MSKYRLPNPNRRRQIPPQFSWVDHRLVRDLYFERGSCEAMALYLFLLTVADQRGLSYYSQPSLMKQLKFGTVRFAQARAELIDLGLIAYEHPLYQVLNLIPTSTLPPHPPETKQCRPAAPPLEIKQLLSQLNPETSDD